jgi:hypothetical protein
MLCDGKIHENNFPFFWYKTEERRRILRKFERKQRSRFSKRKENCIRFIFKTRTEFQYCAIEILIKELKGNYKRRHSTD